MAGLCHGRRTGEIEQNGEQFSILHAARNDPREVQRVKKEVIESFFQRQLTVQDRYVASRYHQNDRLRYDAALIKQYLHADSRVLDLGCGTGLIEEVIAPFAREIVAIDKYEGFLEKAPPLANVRYLSHDVADYCVPEQFDVILLFGVTMYLSDEDLSALLANCHSMLAPNGVLIIKNQWGMEGRVVADGYSKGLETEYYAVYRSLQEMDAMLRQQQYTSTLIDIYPAKLNLWTNTHEYALVIKK